MADQPSHAGHDETRSATTRHPSIRLSRIPPSSPNPNAPHRQSFSDTLRNTPQSPRSRRQPSLTQAAIQGLIDNPPVRNPANPAFNGRDWRQITIGELVQPSDLRFVEVDTGIEEATNVGFLFFKLRLCLCVCVCLCAEYLRF